MNLKVIFLSGFTKPDDLVIRFFFSAVIFRFPYQIYSSVQVLVLPAWMQILTELLFCAQREKKLM